MQQHNPAPLPGAPRPHGRPRGRGGAGMRVQFGAFEIQKRGVTRFDLRDPYHFALSLSWPQFALLFLCLYLGINIAFALLFLLVPGAVANARHGNFGDVFFFSMETLATVGYGAMSPASLYGHLIAAAEIIVGVAFSAIMTGLTFVRFSRARPKVLYAERPVVARFNGRPMLMLRIANGRAGMLVDVRADLAVLLREETHEGQTFRRIHDLKLLRGRLHMFPLTWTLMHELDELSPLHGLDAAALAERDARLFVAVKAHDYVLGADVYDARTYRAEEIAFGMRYVDAVSVDASGHTVADLGRLSLIEPEDPPRFADPVPAGA